MCISCSIETRHYNKWFTFTTVNILNMTIKFQTKTVLLFMISETSIYIGKKNKTIKILLRYKLWWKSQSTWKAFSSNNTPREERSDCGHVMRIEVLAYIQFINMIKELGKRTSASIWFFVSCRGILTKNSRNSPS